MHARAMTEETKADLREVKNRMQEVGSYDNGDNAIRTASSGESSDDSDVEEVLYI